MLRRLSAALAAIAVVAGGLVLGAAPASAIETISVSPSSFTDATQPLDVTIDGFPTMVSGNYYVYWLDFANMTGSNSGSTCPTFTVVGGAGNPVPTGSGTGSNPTLTACSWQTGTTFRFVYEGATGLNSTSQVKVAFPGSSFGLPSGGQYGVNFTAGASQQYQLSYVCLGDCPSGSTGVSVSAPPTVTIDVDGNGGTCTTGRVTGYQSTWALAPDASSCSKPGLAFTGFNTSADRSGLAIAPGGNLHLTGDNRLYAIYVEPRTPGAPTDPVAVAGRNEVKVSWMAPADPGSTGITNYIVEASPSGKVCVTRVSEGDLLSCTFDLPATNTKYSFTVQALNAAGWGEKSSASNAVSPFTLALNTATRTKANFLQRLVGWGSTIQMSARAPGFAVGTAVIPQWKVGRDRWVSEGRDGVRVRSNHQVSWSKKIRRSFDREPVTVRFVIGDVASDEAALRMGR